MPVTAYRSEFRTVLSEVVHCLRSQLDVPGISPLVAADIATWLNQVTREDVEAVWDKR